MPKVFIASDHAGFELKQELVPYIGTLGGYDPCDIGAFELDPDDDYPTYILPCARRVAGEPGSLGIVLGASGQGEAMAANRIEGIRCAVFYGAPRGTQTDAGGNELDLVASVRAHNDANMLSLGARFITLDEARAA
ncbi:MAG TPA: RpiB/LacA/LacB family sugar-phosphate isomerase, partial [Candidatus Paceibacterota bacterium]|nr:RpiB/LacA/LacB family sugar-phosphate isomerase [Candidatus Paceibacterota bacterium]